MRKYALLLSCTFALLGGCGGGGESGETGVDDKRIVWYALMVHPYVEEVQKGVVAYERDTGTKIKRQIGQEWTQDNENANVEPLAAQGYKGFSLYPADASAANGLYEELVQNGAHVVSYGAPTVLPTPIVSVLTNPGSSSLKQTLEAVRKLCLLRASRLPDQQPTWITTRNSLRTQPGLQTVKHHRTH